MDLVTGRTWGGEGMEVIGNASIFQHRLCNSIHRRGKAGEQDKEPSNEIGVRIVAMGQKQGACMQGGLIFGLYPIIGNCLDEKHLLRRGGTSHLLGWAAVTLTGARANIQAEDIALQRSPAKPRGHMLLERKKGQFQTLQQKMG